MERSLLFMILGLGVVWLIMNEFTAEPDKRVISKIVKGITG